MKPEHHKINYIELDVADIKKAKEFYGPVFGWTFTDYGPGYCEFSDGNLKGGFAQIKKIVTAQTEGPLVILYSSNLEETLNRVEKGGAKIAKPIFSFPGGRRFHFIDPNGYELAVWSDV